jgi:tRNA pseudouridine38-40 synthase
MPRTLKLTVSYDGTRFVGWQRQAEGVSVQGLLEDALARFEGGPVTVNGAGRTDAGVHALGQVASVDLTCDHPTDVLVRGLNACLPPDVRVTDVEDAPSGFHARFSARSKTYRYVIRNAPVVSPFERAYVWHIAEPLDVAAMQVAAGALVGTYDFSSFRSTGSEIASAVRTIARSEVHHGARGAMPFLPGPDDKALLAYEVSGNGFLRHMVRAIVGTLVEVGRGRRTATSMATLVASGDRADAGATAPPHGLFLVRVDYD